MIDMKHEGEQILIESDFLKDIWVTYNTDVYNGQLKPISFIGWHNFKDDSDYNHGPFGLYNSKTNAMSISQRFYIVESKDTELMKMDEMNLSKVERESMLESHTPYLEIACGLVAHEMAHQAAFELGNGAKGHGAEFVKYANFFSSNDSNFPPATTYNSDSWPVNILVSIKRLNL